MLDQERFNTGFLYNEFIQMTNEETAVYHHHYNRTVVSEDDRNFLSNLPGLNIAVISEPWCGDSMVILPVIQKWIDSFNHIKMRIFKREDNPDMMDNYLTNGARSVPKIILYDTEFNEIGTWGPRSKPAQKVFNEYHKMLKDGTIEKSVVRNKIRRIYAMDRGKDIIAEIKDNCISK